MCEIKEQIFLPQVLISSVHYLSFWVVEQVESFSSVVLKVHHKDWVFWVELGMG